MTSSLENLSEREREVLRLLARGHDAKSIASSLGVSVHAVNERLREVRRKLGVSSSRAAARMVFGVENVDQREQEDRPKEFGIAGNAAPGVDADRSAGWLASRKRWAVYAFIGGIMLIALISIVTAIDLGIQQAPPTSATNERHPRIPMPIGFAEILARENFPTDAVRRATGTHSRVAWRVEVSAAGRPTNCTITRSSQIAEIDSTVCRLIMDRQTYRPATDAAGRPTAGASRGFIDFGWATD